MRIKRSKEWWRRLGDREGVSANIAGTRDTAPVDEPLTDSHRIAASIKAGIFPKKLPDDEAVRKWLRGNEALNDGSSNVG